MPSINYTKLQYACDEVCYDDFCAKNDKILIFAVQSLANIQNIAHDFSLENRAIHHMAIHKNQYPTRPILSVFCQ